MAIEEYLQSINQRYRLGNSTEHTFRGDLERLIESLVPGIRATNEPKRQSCGAPDYILTRKDIPVGFIEAKDIGDPDLLGIKKSGNKEQFDRYRTSLGNILFTDYLDFYLFREGQLVTKVSIGEVKGGIILPINANFGHFKSLLQDFCTHVSQTIKSSRKLAEMMAGKARLLSDIIEKALTSDETHNEDSTLKDQMNAFKQILIHDITPKGFADVYAQTIAYGMFAARLHDTTLSTFTRQEAAELIPKSNPFLRKLFGYIAGPDIDDRIKWIVDSLSEIFKASDVSSILKNFGNNTKTQDPIIHFYETFLSEYDPKLRKSRGVWYTPQPIVNFIVRIVDEVLTQEFNLPLGIGDTSKTTIKVGVQKTDKRYSDNKKTIDKEIHKVQILDPAAGTGTFLAEVINIIYSKFQNKLGFWNEYVETELLPRINGFELLMASYAMAHLKINLLLNDTGFQASKDQRLRIFLTNSLEEYHPETGTLFAEWLSSEANEANRIKKDIPVMCVIGNPPYSGISSNNNEWISGLIDDYKFIDGEHFNERKHWLNDDYVKFIRFGQHFIDNNSIGILAYINPHGFLDNPTFRGMRWNLMKSFDKIYTIDLHGNSKKKEVIPGGITDINVFEIQQGVSINIMIKSGKKKSNTLGKVFHADLYGSREYKYDFLSNNNLQSIEFKELNPTKPNYYFIPQNNIGLEDYNKGFSIDELFPINVTGIVTARDSLVINTDRQDLLTKIETFCNDEFSDQEIRTQFFPNKASGKYLAGDSRGWKLATARIKVKDFNHSALIKKIDYRPFDTRYIYYSPEMVDWGREKFMHNFNYEENYGIVASRQSTDGVWSNIQITKNMIDNRYHFSYKGIPSQFPLYLYSMSPKQQDLAHVSFREPNLNENIISRISNILGMEYTKEKQNKTNTFAPIDILDYIYGVLHSPNYRAKNNEFLKLQFPRIPYPKDISTFKHIIKNGEKLRQLHTDFIHTLDNINYPISGDNYVDKVRFNENRVYINDNQFFENVTEDIWNFYIGGYQPAQKWLKDRKGKKLTFDNIQHYQKIIVTIQETIKVMSTIDKL